MISVFMEMEKINYTHGSQYTFPLEYAQERIGKKGLKHDPIKSRIIL